MSDLLIDTNILIYLIDKNSRYFQATHKLIQGAQYHFFTTCKNISEFLAVVTRGPSPALSIEKALQVVKDFTKLFVILYPSHDSFLLFQKLVGLYKPTGLKVHDLEIISIALSYQITRVATLNYKDFSNIREIELIKIV